MACFKLETKLDVRIAQNIYTLDYATTPELKREEPNYFQ